MIGEFIGLLAALATALGGFVLLTRPARKTLADMLEWFCEFRRTWDGEPAKPNRAARPGVPERLNRIDGELSRNHGTTLKDKVEAIARDVSELTEAIGRIEQRQLAIKNSLSSKEARK